MKKKVIFAECVIFQHVKGLARMSQAWTVHSIASANNIDPFFPHVKQYWLGYTVLLNRARIAKKLKKDWFKIKIFVALRRALPNPEKKTCQSEKLIIFSLTKLKVRLLINLKNKLKLKKKIKLVKEEYVENTQTPTADWSCIEIDQGTSVQRIISFDKVTMHLR